MANGLNAAQQDAVATLSGPLLVLAGAGTGKTRVVTHRIAELIRRGVRPARILAVTFTNKAAKEMATRAAALLPRASAERPEISTFHSLCVRILRRHAPLLGYPAQFAIYDRGDCESLARRALAEIRVPDEVMRAGDLVNQISRWKMLSIGPERAASQAASDREHLASMAFRRYQQVLKLAGAVDFDDLLGLTEELFQRFPAARRAEAERFSHLLIDEYQDTNAVQYRIVRGLAGGHRNLCVVGDDDQSIYGWRGADVSHILRFQHDWPEARVVRLEENYRSTAPILELANRLIKHNTKRHDKQLRPARPGGEKPRIVQCADGEAEARQVVEDIRRRLADGVLQPRDFAILFRTNEQPRPFEFELRKARLPYVLLGGTSFYDRSEIRDILAYLKLLVAPRDEVSLRRILNRPARGIGRKAQATLIERALAAGKSTWDILPEVKDDGDLTPAAAAAVAEFRRTVLAFGERAKQEPLAELVRQLIDRIGYRAEIARAYKDPKEQQARWESIEEVVSALAAYEAREKRPSLAGFLDEIALADRDQNDEQDKQLAKNAIALLTLHSAKGLEFPQVYLVGMEEGLLPHRKSVEADGAAIDEERRLCYVGITRAQDRLTISLALSRLKWGKPRPSKPSRFLFEITGHVDSTARRARGPSASRPAAGRLARSASRRGKKPPPRRRG